MLGLFCIPIRFNTNKSVYEEYLDFLVQSETAGYEAAFIGEHLSDEREDIQSSIVFAAALLARTSQISVGLSVLPLPHYDIKLLVKQLEDLYSLGNGRLHIGFGPGALRSDLLYLDINPELRAEIFNNKLRQLRDAKARSRVLSNMEEYRWFSTLLSASPVASTKLNLLGNSGFTSNFCHHSHLPEHYRCLTEDRLNPLNGKWHIGMNLIPNINELSAGSRNTIRSTLLYIYAKLGPRASTIMLGSNREVDGLSEQAIGDLLLQEQVITHKDYLEVKSELRLLQNGGFTMVNLFDCLNDLCYVEQILSLPTSA